MLSGVDGSILHVLRSTRTLCTLEYGPTDVAFSTKLLIPAFQPPSCIISIMSCPPPDKERIEHDTAGNGSSTPEPLSSPLENHFGSVFFFVFFFCKRNEQESQRPGGALHRKVDLKRTTGLRVAILIQRPAQPRRAQHPNTQASSYARTSPAHRGPVCRDVSSACFGRVQGLGLASPLSRPKGSRASRCLLPSGRASLVG